MLFRSASAVDRRRAQRAIGHYLVHGGVLSRILADGSSRIVPPVADRLGIVSAMHEGAGHFGQRRTFHLVATAYWWVGMHATVQECVSQCIACDRVKSSFGERSPTLHPLPIEGLFYRWGVDLCGPFDTSDRGSKYVMICIEHYSKWVEAIPISSKLSSCTTVTFRQHILGRFGSCAEVVTDQGTEW